jgi:type II secretory pathway pseudopilin PulG
MVEGQFRKAFSILELAIVIIIIAIMISSSLKMTSFIRNQELKNIMTTVSSYHKSVQSFYDLYATIPGDMSNASTLISSDIVNNGNGDEFVDAYNSDEGLYVFEHLYYADLITFLPIYTASIPDDEIILCSSSAIETKYPGYNIPWIKANNSFLAVAYMQDSDVSSDRFTSYVIGNGKTCNENYSYSQKGVVTPEEAKLLYDKYSGRIPRPDAFAFNESKSFSFDNSVKFGSIDGEACDYKSVDSLKKKVCYIFYQQKINN